MGVLWELKGRRVTTTHGSSESPLISLYWLPSVPTLRWLCSTMWVSAKMAWEFGAIRSPLWG